MTPESSAALPWTARQLAGSGVVHFRGSMAPRPDDFDDLARHGVTIGPDPAADAGPWSLRLEHRDWGVAKLRPMTGKVPSHRQLLKAEPRLTEAERADAAAGASAVLVTTPASAATGNVLRDRKRLLRWMRAVMGADGVVAYDSPAQRFWSPAALDEELAHDADLDVESVFTCHLVTGDDGTGEGGNARWLHSHGLAELGGFDFDVLRPSPDLTGRCWDLTRAIAFAVLDGKLAMDGPAAKLFSRGEVRAVDVGSFNRRATPVDRAARDPDPAHNRGRAVLCDPAAGWSGRLFGRPTSAAVLTGDLGDFFLLFPHAATRLMADRARRTFDLFRSLAGEFAGRGFKPLVKLAHRVDRGGPADLEHLWFDVADLRPDGVTAVPTKDAEHVVTLRRGVPVFTPLEQLTDWAIRSPFGTMTPRDLRPARAARASTHLNGN